MAAVCCNGRIVSVLEGGYGISNRKTLDRKNFANCVVGQLLALVDRNLPCPGLEGESDEEVAGNGSSTDSSSDEMVSTDRPPPNFLP